VSCQRGGERGVATSRFRLADFSPVVAISFQAILFAILFAAVLLLMLISKSASGTQDVELNWNKKKKRKRKKKQEKEKEISIESRSSFYVVRRNI